MAPGPFVDFFFFFFRKQPIKVATPASTLNHGTPSPGQSATGGNDVGASSQSRHSQFNWQQKQRQEEGVWLFDCPVA